MSTQENVQMCVEARRLAAEAVSRVLGGFTVGSEVDLHAKLAQALADQPRFFAEGWYSPPPGGIGVLIGSANDNNRTKYTSFREEPYWPNATYQYTNESVCLLHVSPVDKTTGIIGDFGMTAYRGDDANVQEHIRRSLETIEAMADYSQVGMSLRELYEYCAALLKQQSLQFDMTAHSSASLSFGHTIPWSHEAQTDSEMAIIKSGDMEHLKQLISSKRLYLDNSETFKIPKTIAFTTEARLANTDNPNLPNVYFHTLVTFTDGIKQIHTGFNQVFDTLGMNYIRSRYE